MLEDAHDLFPPCDVPRPLDGPCSPYGAHGRAHLPDPPLRASSADEARDCASSLKDGHASCSSVDVHGVLAFSVPAPALVLRRSRSHSLSGPAVVRSHAFAQKRPSAISSAFTTKSSWPRSPFRACRVRLSTLTAALHRLTVYGLANSCHVSTRAGFDPLLFEDRAFTSHSAIAPALAFRPWRLPAVQRRVSCPPCDVHAPLCRTLTRFDHAHLATFTLETSHRCACVHLSFRTDFRSHRNLAAPALRSTCISRRSRSSGTSVLTFAHVFVVLRVFFRNRDPRSRTCSVTSFDAVLFRFGHLRMPRPASLSTSRNSAPFER
jgi:hypothetical protein